MINRKHIGLLLAICWLYSGPYAIAQLCSWKSVKAGGGGFVTGLIFNPSEKGLLYARTDVGGAYRWNEASRSWVALTDFITDENNSGILSLATDATDVNRVYIATGLYTQPWSGNAALFASNDKGDTWTKYDLPFKLGGNEDGRSAGERLQVDPGDHRILYLGTTKNGIWKSADYGATWGKLKAFSAKAADNAGVAFVLPDKNSVTSGKATTTLYAGCFQKGAGLYRSLDAGKNWELLPGQPEGLVPQHAVSTRSGKLYISFTDAPGPNNITKGAVYVYDTRSSQWTQLHLPEGMGGFAGISASAVNGDTLLVSTLNRWAPRDELFRSIDGGISWKALLASGNYDCTMAPYATASTPHWIGDLATDPFDAGNAWFVTGYGVFHTTQLAAADHNQPVHWLFDNNGLEEMVVSALICPPAGAPLLSTVWDLDGFRHDQLDQSPEAGNFTPKQGHNFSIDFAQNQPAYIVRAFPNAKGNYGALSVNGGTGWRCFTAYPEGSNGAGVIALTADGSTIVWSPGGAGMSWSADSGNTWHLSAGIPLTLKPVTDRVNGAYVYAYDAASGRCYVSTDHAASFSAITAGLPVLPGYQQGKAEAKTVFGKEGHIWCTAGDNGLYHSTNAGKKFIKNAAVQQANKIAFGKAAPGAAYPTIYLAGKVYDLYGIFRSVDKGNTWIRINSDRNQYLGIRALAADANVFGRVYVGTSGRGIVYGEEN